VVNEDAGENYSNGKTSSGNQSREPKPGGASDTQTKRNLRFRKAPAGRTESPLGSQHRGNELGGRVHLRKSVAA
jgi:hypothetical protein